MNNSKKSSPKPLSEREQSLLEGASLDRELVFHYSREHRLARASQVVQTLNDPDAVQKRPSLFGSVTSNKANRLLLIVIIVLLVLISFMSRTTKEKNTPVLGGNTLSYSAVQGQGITYLTIKKSFKGNGAGVYTGAVDMMISPAFSTGKNAPPVDSLPIETHRIFFTSKPQEEYGISLPFQADALAVFMQTETDLHTMFRVKLK